jgi:hypothetical protein
MPTPTPVTAKTLSLDSQIAQLRRWFETFTDKRARNTRYALADVLLSAYAMFALKYPSLLSFETQTQQEAHNLTTLFGIKRLCSDAQMRNILDVVKPETLRPFWRKHFKTLKQCGIRRAYLYQGNRLIVSVDGVEHFRSANVHCPHCLTRTMADKTISYSHAMLCAVLVHPQQQQVFVLGAEPILRQDGETKNDCEQTAAKRLLTQMTQDYKGQKLLFVQDALYAYGPYINQLRANKWDFIIGVKPDSHVSLFAKWQARRNSGQLLKTFTCKDEQGLVHRFEYFSGVCLNEKYTECRVNFVHYQQEDKLGKALTFSWVTSMVVNPKTLMSIMRAGRSRWKIENETFNTLKNQGYGFEHNYGHGQAHLSTVLALLMLMAFTTDQLVERVHVGFGLLWKGAKTKAKLWATFRALFMVSPQESFAHLYRQAAQLLRVKIT